MSSDDAFAFVDELLSFFVDDEDDDDDQQQQQLVTEDAETAVATDGGGDDDDPLRFLETLSTEPLNAEEVAEILRNIDGDGNQQQGWKRAPDLTPQQLGGGGFSGESTPVKSKKTFRNYNPNKARNGRKEELAFLRMTARELEARLDVLRKKKERESLSTVATRVVSPSPIPSGTSSSSSLVVRQQQQLGNDNSNEAVLQPNFKLKDVWRETARHQCDERHKSERENLRLRMVLENQLKVAKSLEKFLLLKAAATKEIHKCVSLPLNPQFPHSNFSYHHPPSEAALFHDLLVGVEQSIAQVDSVFEENGFTQMETNQMNAQVRFAPEKGGLFVEVCATKVLPFGVHETGEAVWNHCTFAKQRMPARYYSYAHKSTDATANTVVEDFSLELHVKNTRASFRVRQIVRRVIEEERVVIVWHSFSDPLEYSKQPLSGLRLFEKGYTVVRKSPSSVPGSCVTLLQSYNIVSTTSILDEAGVLNADDAVVGAITDFTLCEATDFIAGRHQMVENALMEQTLTGDRSSVASCS